jgi:hypothetical protein
MQIHHAPLSFVVALATLAFACGGDDNPASQSSEGSTAADETSTGDQPADTSTDPSPTDPSSSSGGPPSVDELASCEEADLQVLPFMGPAFDPRTGELVMPLPQPHVVATTAGWVASQEDWQMADPLTTGAMEDVFQREGLLGASFGISVECGASRTITLWQDEASMMAFVLGDAHMAAMQDGLQYTIGWETTRWTEMTSDQPATWDVVREKLDQARQ